MRYSANSFIANEVLLSDYLQQFLRASRARRGIYSVCSAHPWVIEAAMRQAQQDNTHLLLEATSNQVNQAGGYTGGEASTTLSATLKEEVLP